MTNGPIIITGADGGLGTTVTGGLLSAGFSLVAGALNEAAAERLKKAFPDAYGDTLKVVIADLGTEEGVQSLISGISNPAGLVHLAGGYTAGNSISDYKDADFTYLMNLNARPTFLLLKYLMPLFKQQQSGSIITIGAKPALHAVSGNAVYTASKSAVIALTLSAAEEGRAFNVRANCIVPAALQTPGNLSWASKEVFETFTPLEDVSNTIQFLMSSNATGITGTIIPMYNKIPS